VVVGARGLFILSPVLLLALYGFVVMLRDRQYRPEGLLFAGSFAVYLLMLSGYKIPPTDIWTPGPRFLIPVLPFLAAPVAFSVRRLPWLFLPLAAISVAIMFVVTAANPQVPPEVSNPLLSYWLPGFFDRSQLVHTLPELRFGISKGLSLVLLAGAVALVALAAGSALLLQRRPGSHTIAWNAVLVLVLIVYLIIAFPIDLRAPFDLPPSLRGPRSIKESDPQTGQLLSVMIHRETLSHGILAALSASKAKQSAASSCSIHQAHQV
jgi:hypothetical protein